MVMKRFTAPDRYDVWVNVGAIELVHPIRLLHPDGSPPSLDAPLKQGAKIIFASGQFQYVREQVDEVLAEIHKEWSR